MKNILSILALLIISQTTWSQNIIDDHFSHIEAREDATSINITGKLFSLAAHISDTGDEEADEALDFLSSISLFRLVAVEDINSGAEEYGKAVNIVRDNMDELMVIRSKDGNFSLYIDENDGIVNELVGVGNGDSEFMIFSLLGEMNLKQIGKVAHQIQMEGFEEMKSIEDFDISEVKVYPNPVTSSGNFTVEAPDQFEDGTITLYDEAGAFVKEFTLENNKQRVSNVQLSSGVYYVNVEKDGVSVKKKLIVVE